MSGFFSFLAAIFGWLTGKRHKDSETQVAENDLAAKQREAEMLAAPLPPDDVLNRIVREHQEH